MRLSCSNISFQYPQTERAVFKNLSLEIEGPGFHALFGPSGIGKTSFAKIISGDLKAFEGQATIESKGAVLYSYNLERLPGWSAVGKHLDRITVPSQEAIKKALMERFDMLSCSGIRFAQLSLGQKNRINLIRYLLQSFEILILDESLANVDQATRERIILAIKALFPDKFFFYISHNIVEVAKFCDKILILRDQSKTPQAIVINGLNYKGEAELEKSRLEKTMLEIMNAA